MLWKTHRDQLAVVLIILIVALFVFDVVMRVQYGAGLSGEVLGFLIAVGMLVGQFYFRKSGPEPPS